MANRCDTDSIPDRSRPGITTTARPIDVCQDGREKSTTGLQQQINLQKETVTLGTWNVLSLYQPGKVHELTHALERYRWDIIGLAEVRWTGIGELITEDGQKIWWSGNDRLHEHGVGFIVRKELLNSVISCTPISERIIMLRLAAKPHNLSIIQCYAPTSDHSDDEVEEFYDLIDETIAKIPKKDIKAIVGDLNAKIGPDAYEHWKGTVGKFGVGETNDRGTRLLEFAKKHKLTIANTLHPHKISRRTTWHHPSGRHHNQIDFILLPERFKSSINKAQTRSFPGADIGSDHDLVMTNFRLRLRKQKKPDTHRIRFDLEKLKDPTIAQHFEATIGGKFAALNLVDCNIDELADNISNVLNESATEVLGKKKKKLDPWVTDEVLVLCDARRELKKTKYDNEQCRNNYREANKNVKRKMKEAKESWIQNKCTEIDQSIASTQSRKAYEAMRTITSSQQPKSMVIENGDGDIITEESSILTRWTEYCTDLYNYELHPDESILEPDTPPTHTDPSPGILPAEIEAAIKTLKPGKSPGVDNVPAELITHGGETIKEAFTILCQKIWDSKQWPKKWTHSLVIPLPKKGDLKKCQNYRTISLISHPSKVLLRVILNRLKPQSETILAEEQAGFRSGRSTAEQILNCRLLIEKHLEHQKELYHNFIDFKKAFDRVWHDGLWTVLRGFMIDEDLIQLIQSLYNNANSSVLLNDSIGEAFRTSVGVRQGCLLSPVLFNLFLERIMSEALINFEPGVSIGGRPICNLRFADDIDLMGSSNEELQELTNNLAQSAGRFGMEISSEKSKVMVNSNSNNATVNISMDGVLLESVDSFKYLGATLSKDGSSLQETKIRIASANAALSKLDIIWKSKISFKTKFQLYRTLVLSILMYSAETWTLNAEAENRLTTFERKAFRKLLGITFRDRRTNEYVYEKVEQLIGKYEPVLESVKRRKFQMFGHIARHNNLQKTIMQGTVEGNRGRGRPKLRWNDNLKKWSGLTQEELLQTADNRTLWRQTTGYSLRNPRRPPHGYGN